MSKESFVVVFPSIFSQKKMALLMTSVKKILKIRDQPYSSIKRDGPVITIKANDPVFASSAIGLLYGIKRVAIARQTENNFDNVASTMAKIGSSLLLNGDRFHVKIEGEIKGFLPKDLEMAVTTRIIEKTSKMTVHPGTEQNHDRLLYAFLTKSNAYICIFIDEGLGGVPFGTHDQKIICAVFDELSAVSCIETIRQGFHVKIIVCYRKHSELSNLVKMINQIIPRTVAKEIELEFFNVSMCGYSTFFLTAMNIIEEVAKKTMVNHIVLPVSPLIFPSKFIDSLLLRFNKQEIIPHIPIVALEEGIYRNAKEIGLGKFISNIGKLVKVDFSVKNNLANIKTSKKILIKIGPNNIHEMLDQLTMEH